MHTRNQDKIGSHEVINRARKYYINGNQRYYHTWDYVQKGLGLINRKLFGTPSQAQVISWLYHASIFSPTNRNNRELSAHTLYNDLIDDVYPQTVSEAMMIVANSETLKPLHTQAYLILDMDLLRFSGKDCMKHELALRKEYRIMSDTDYIQWRGNRVNILVHTPSLYFHETLKPFEAATKANLIRIHDWLAKGMKDNFGEKAKVKNFKIERIHL